MQSLIKNKYKFLFLFFSIVFFVLRIININAPVTSDLYYSFRTSETAIVIQDFFRNGFSFFHSNIPVYGKPWTLVFEFPLYQAIVYFIMRIVRSHNIDLCGRFISIIIYYFGLAELIRVVKKIVNENAAYVVGVAYTISFFNLYWSRAILIDYLSVFLSLAYLYCFYQLIKNEISSFCYLVGIFAGIAGYLTKATTMFVVVFFVVFLTIDNEMVLLKREYKHDKSTGIKKYFSNHLIRLLKYIPLAIIPVIFGYFWTVYADKMKSMSRYTEYLTSESLSEWNYGTIEQKTTVKNWLLIGDRYLPLCGGGLLFCLIIVIYLLFTEKKYMKIVVFSWAAQFLTIFILFNLYYQHFYYFIALSPFVYMSLGIMLYEIIGTITYKKKATVAILLVGIMLLQINQYNNYEYFDGIVHVDTRNNSIGKLLDRITKEDELIIITDEEWSPDTLYAANRRGFMGYALDKKRKGEFSSFFKADNYTTLVTHDLEKADNILDAFDTIVAYPVVLGEEFKDAESTYIFKFDDNTFVGNNYEHKTDITRSDMYHIDNYSTDKPLTISYSTDENIFLACTIVDDSGIRYGMNIPLIASRNTTKVYFGHICNTITGIQFGLGEESNITIMY